MPDDRGMLSAAEKRDLIDKINKLWVGSAKNCPICGSNKWVLADHLVSAPIVTAGAGITIGGPSYPSVQLISEPCGYTIHFNAVVLGIVKSSGSGLT
jgi:hypothetical protein